MVTLCPTIWVRWRKHFCHLLNIRRINEVKQANVHTAEPLVPWQNAFEFEMATV